MLGAPAFIWTVVPCHSRVLSCSKAALCPPCSQGCCSTAPPERCFASPTFGHPWATLYRPRCLADTVGLFPRRTIRVLGYFTRQRVPLRIVVDAQKRGSGVLLGMGEPSQLSSPCLQMPCYFLCSVLWEFVNNSGDRGVYQLRWEQKKTEEGFGQTKTKWDNISVPL